MREGLGVLIAVWVILLILLGYIEGRAKQNLIKEVETLKLTLDIMNKMLEASKKQINNRLAFDEKCLYDLVRKSEEPNNSHEEDKKK